jgi:hypothetical protein
MAREKDATQTGERFDAYFGLNVIATIALLTGLLFLYLDYSSYSPPPKALTKTQAGVNIGGGGNVPPPPTPVGKGGPAAKG